MWKGLGTWLKWKSACLASMRLLIPPNKQTKTKCMKKKSSILQGIRAGRYKMYFQCSEIRLRTSRGQKVKVGNTTERALKNSLRSLP
jgi:hypothetical protein